MVFNAFGRKPPLGAPDNTDITFNAKLTQSQAEV